jgi:hypothetical protein
MKYFAIGIAATELSVSPLAAAQYPENPILS